MLSNGPRRVTSLCISSLSSSYSLCIILCNGMACSVPFAELFDCEEVKMKGREWIFWLIPATDHLCGIFKILICGWRCWEWDEGSFTWVCRIKSGWPKLVASNACYYLLIFRKQANGKMTVYWGAEPNCLCTSYVLLQRVKQVCQGYSSSLLNSVFTMAKMLVSRQHIC